MKTLAFRKWSFGLLLAAIPVVGGCDAGSVPSSAAATTVALEVGAAEVPVGTNAPVGDALAEDEMIAVEDELVTAEGRIVSAEKPLPPAINPHGVTAEIIKLAHAGVEEEVMLAFVASASGTFNLGSEEIIFLNDIGVPGSVITAMIQRDQTLKDSSVAAAESARTAAANQLVAAPGTPTPFPASGQAAAPEGDTQLAYAEGYSPPAEQVTYSQFYDALAPYGNWIEVENYGRVWQPTVVVVNPHWRPYFDRGRWVYTDHGWYWLSDYSWGWAPFHYGRWFQHHRWGWCWAPGTVWGPAWVSWRYSDAYCGWAPLPPSAHYYPGVGFSYYGRSVGVGFSFGLGVHHYSFVPISRFCDYRPFHYGVPRHQVTHIYNRTTVINNIIVGDNNRIINRGIAPERITAVTKTEVRKVQVRDASPTASRNYRHERLDADGRTLAVYRPNLPSRSAENPRGEWRRDSTPQAGSSSAAIVTTGRTIPNRQGFAPVDTTRTRTSESASTPSRDADRVTTITRPGSDFGNRERHSAETRTVTPGGSPATDTAAKPAMDAARRSQVTARTIEPREPREPRERSIPQVAQPTPAPTETKSSETATRHVPAVRPQDRATTTGATPQPRQAAPLILHGRNSDANTSSAARENTPSGSLVVIGRNNSQPQSAAPQATPAEPQRHVPVFRNERATIPSRTTTPAPAQPQQWSAPSTPATPAPSASPQRVFRQETPNYTPRTISPPVTTPSVPAQRQFAPPPTPATPAPAARQYTAPTFRSTPMATPQPAPSYAPPARSIPAMPAPAPAPRPQVIESRPAPSVQAAPAPAPAPSRSSTFSAPSRQIPERSSGRSR